MKKPVSTEVKRGQAISFRVPSDTPDHLLKHLQKLKETERRNFSSKIAEFVLTGVGQSISQEKEMVSIPLPHQLTKEQRNWLKHEHSEAMLGSIVYQLLSDPTRAASLLSSLNSNSLDINEALYLQEESEINLTTKEENVETGTISATELDSFDDDIGTFELERTNEDNSVHQTAEEEDSNDDDLNDLLGDFLAEMNK